MKFSVNVFLLLLSIIVFGQNKEGYWDNARATSEIIELGAGKRKAIKTADFPEGTTEVVYRISLLDDNQKITSSLVSVLKAIPDPSGISQGSAGAVFLLSTISGNDKCKYAVFGTEYEAMNYEVSGETKTACVVQNNPINKEAKLVSTNSKCLYSGITNMWFGFESDNWVLKEKIVLEVVPWVDFKLQKGWTNQAKMEVLAICKNLEVNSMIVDKERFWGYFLDLVVKNYKYKEFVSLLQEEKSKLIIDYTDKALQQSGEYKSVTEFVRNEAAQLFNSGNAQSAIDLIQNKLIYNNLATITDYNTLGYYYLLTRQFVKGLRVLEMAEGLDNSALDVKLNLANAYLLTDNFKKAKEIHKRYQNQNISATVSWKSQTKNDFELFKSRGIESKGFGRILNIIE